MASLVRTFPVALSIVAAFAAPFLAAACSDVQTLPSSSSTGTSGGSSSVTSSAGSSSTGGAGSTGGSAVTSTTGVTTSGGSGSGTSTSGSGSGGGGGAAATSSGSSSGAGGAESDAGDAGDPDSSMNCGTTVTPYAIDPSPHIAMCFPVTYSSNPPTSGPHYPVWASFKTFTSPVPRGFTVHDLEHGAIVISYKCPAGCASEVAAIQALVDARAADPGCLAPVKSRIVITPDPLLDVPFAAAAWGFALTSQCFDLPALGAFIDAHYGMGPESFCADGVDVSSPDAGIPEDCGEAQDAGAGPG